MVPESVENKTIELYECTEFPFKWKFKMNLMEKVIAVDTTLFHHKGKWWLFTGIARHERSLPLVELFLFSANELFTNEWNSHPKNPIVNDVMRARPAGKIFAKDGKIYRPSRQHLGKNAISHTVSPVENSDLVSGLKILAIQFGGGDIKVHLVQS